MSTPPRRRTLEYSSPSGVIRPSSARFCGWAFVLSGAYAIACFPAVLYFGLRGWNESPLHLTSFVACIVCVVSASVYLFAGPRNRCLRVMAAIALVSGLIFLGFIAAVLLLMN